MGSSIGTKLQEARVRRGETVADVAHVTRISGAQIRAMEADDFSVFPDSGYARRFLVLYAEHLGLGGEEIGASLPEAKPGRRLPRNLGVPVRSERIPIVKGLPVPVRRTAKSILTPLAALVILLLLPSAFLLGKRVGENGVIRESRETRAQPPGTPMAVESGRPEPGPVARSGS
jgi:cytoskeleton protein RodZ